MIATIAVVRRRSRCKTKIWELKGNPKSQGIVLLNPFTTILVKIPTRTVNKEITLNLPSKEGLNVVLKSPFYIMKRRMHKHH